MTAREVHEIARAFDVPRKKEPALVAFLLRALAGEGPRMTKRMLRALGKVEAARLRKEVSDVL